jgi:hypothetical protein
MSVMTDTGRNARLVASPAIVAVSNTASGTPIHNPRCRERRLSLSRACDAWPMSTSGCAPIATSRRTTTSLPVSGSVASGSIATPDAVVVMLTVPVLLRK